MDIVASLLITMSVTFYIPAQGGINGDLHMADGTEAHIGYAACGPRYPFGTVFEITEDMRPYGVPQAFECRDRGGAVGNFNLDLVMRTGDLKQDWAYAKAWGKRRVPVRVHKNWGEYIAAQQAEHDAAAAARAARQEEASFVTPMP
jgi:3D (Asp-Asp-Asp) domain-containing protein